MIRITTNVIALLLTCYNIVNIPIVDASRRSRATKVDERRQICDFTTNHLEFRRSTSIGESKKFYEIGREKVIFHVKASTNYVEIFVSASPTKEKNLFKITIGKNDNSKTSIEKYATKNKISRHTTATTTHVLKETEYRGFWISFKNQILAVGKINQDVAFITFKDAAVDNVRYISFTTLWTQKGGWIIGRGLSSQKFNADWCEMSSGSKLSLSSSAVKIRASNGTEINICRAVFSTTTISGYASVPNGDCIVAESYLNSRKLERYQFLFGTTVRWQAVHNRMTPHTGALVGGWTYGQKPIFICRFKENDRIFIGSAFEDGSCWSSENGQPYFQENYDILIQDVF